MKHLQLLKHVPNYWPDNLPKECIEAFLKMSNSTMQKNTVKKSSLSYYA